MTIRALTSADRQALAVFTCARLGEPWAEAVQDAIRNDLADQVASGDVSAMGLFDQGGALCGVAAWRIYDVTLPALCRGDIVAVAVREQGLWTGAQGGNDFRSERGGSRCGFVGRPS